MRTALQTASSTPVNLALPAGFRITSLEQKELVETGSLTNFLRTDWEICRVALECGSSPAEFASIRLHFPFVRNAPVFGLNTPQEYVSRWLEAACLAGHDLGLKRPDLEDQVLPGLVREETAQALESLKCLGREYPKEDLEDHFERVMLITVRPQERGKEVVEFTRLLVKAWRTGFLAATEDGVLNDAPEIKGKLAPAWLSGSRALTMIAWVRSCSLSVGRSAAENMEHPLLKVARQYSEKKPTEQVALGGFFADHLATHLRSERECDFSAGALLDWVRAGLAFGKRFLCERPDWSNAPSKTWGPRSRPGSCK